MHLEVSMKNLGKLFILSFSLTIIALVLTACAVNSTDNSKFPTGQFVSKTDSNLEYWFEKDQTWSYYLGGLMSGKGTYKVDGNLWIEQGTDECPFPGTYEWSFDGNNLTFKLQGEDQCDPRREATDNQTFVLKK